MIGVTHKAEEFHEVKFSHANNITAKGKANVDSRVDS